MGKYSYFFVTKFYFYIDFNLFNLLILIDLKEIYFRREFLSFCLMRC